MNGLLGICVDWKKTQNEWIIFLFLSFSSVQRYGAYYMFENKENINKEMNCQPLLPLDRVTNNSLFMTSCSEWREWQYYIKMLLCQEHLNSHYFKAMLWFNELPVPKEVLSKGCLCKILLPVCYRVKPFRCFLVQHNRWEDRCKHVSRSIIVQVQVGVLPCSMLWGQKLSRTLHPLPLWILTGAAPSASLVTSCMAAGISC